MSGGASERIEFVVVAKEDLHLVGACKAICRVTEGDRYPVQMQKNQSFSTLFRHYAKYHGLCKDKLSFSFVDFLKNQDTPESVHIMGGDEVYVESLQSAPPETQSDHENCSLGASFRSLLESCNHSDVTLMVGPEKEIIRAHKAILATRSEYFANMFRGHGDDHGWGRGCMHEALSGQVHFPERNVDTMKLVLEFIYTGSIASIGSIDCERIMDLIMMADELLYPELQVLCLEHTVATLSVDNICQFTKFMQNIPQDKAKRITAAVHRFILDNIDELNGQPAFRELVQDLPQLSLFLVDSVLTAPPHKRRRMSEANS